MGMKIGTGWREREAVGKAAMALRESGYNLMHTERERGRQEMYAAKAEADRLAQEAAEALIRNTVSVCPCCSGKGHIAVPDAAKVVEALRRYDFVGWKPDAQTIGELMRSAITVDRDGNRVSETNRVDPVMTNADDAAGSDAEALAAVEAENAKSAKAQRRRVAPLPFMDGGE